MLANSKSFNLKILIKVKPIKTLQSRFIDVLHNKHFSQLFSRKVSILFCLQGVVKNIIIVAVTKEFGKQEKHFLWHLSHLAFN